MQEIELEKNIPACARRKKNCVVYTLCTQGVNDDVVVDEDTILFMHDTTSWEALDVHKKI